MLEVLGEDYVRTARAKGLSPAASSGSMRCATR
jgi:ABC-type dipeptide/oligopeptide/nickel transport system permease component